MDKNTLKQKFNALCEEYRKAFVEYYFTEEEDGVQAESWWISDEPGGVLCVNDDVFFGFDEMRYCIDNEVEYEDLVEWYDYTLRLGLIDEAIPTPNLTSWLKGCPRYSEEQLQEIEKGKRKVMALEEEIKIMIKGMKEVKPNKKQF